MMAVMLDPLHQRVTFFVELEAEAFTLTERRKWHHLRCNQCGAFKVCSIFTDKKTLKPWVCVSVQTWTQLHRCAETKEPK